MAVLKTISQIALPNSATEAYNGAGMFPVGSIMAWIPGYYTNASNAGYTRMLGAADAAIQANAYLNPFGWFVCDGSPVNDSISPIFGGTTRYLPNLGDDRFLNGFTACSAGQTGSKTTSVLTDHTHTINGGATAAGQSYSGSGTFNFSGPSGLGNIDGHTHTTSAAGGVYLSVPGTNYKSQAGYSGPSASQNFPAWNQMTGLSPSGSIVVPDLSHSHTFGANVSISHSHGTSAVTGQAGTGSAPGSTENRPRYLKCFYVMRIK